jgi:hypothetical protein
LINKCNICNHWRNNTEATQTHTADADKASIIFTYKETSTWSYPNNANK